MINFLRGKVHELTPTYAILDINGIGYYVGISLQTSQKLSQGMKLSFIPSKFSEKMLNCFSVSVHLQKKKF